MRSNYVLFFFSCWVRVDYFLWLAVGVDLMTTSEQKLNDDVVKGMATKAQLSVWDSLLEGRIRAQKCLSLVNRLPQPDARPEFAAQGGQPLRAAFDHSKQFAFPLCIHA